MQDQYEQQRLLQATYLGHKPKGALGANHEVLDDLNGVVSGEVHQCIKGVACGTKLHWCGGLNIKSITTNHSVDSLLRLFMSWP